MIERGHGRLFSYDLSSTGDDPDRTAPVGERTPHLPANSTKTFFKKVTQCK